MQKIRVTQPAELLAAVPYLIGFHPSDSLIIVGIRSSKLHFAVRADLDECHTASTTAAQQLATVLARQKVDAAIVIGYGSIKRVTPAVDSVRQSLVALSIPIVDALRVTEGRFYSYDCVRPECCPPEGRAFQPETSVIAAEATFAGHVALPNRATLAGRIAPIEEPARTAMAEATNRAEARLVTGLERPGGHRDLVAEGVELIEAALNRHYSGDVLTDDETAWLSTLLLLVEVGDAARQVVEQRPEDAHIPLWTDVTRRAQPGMVAPASTLLAYAAYLTGQGGLASVALERAHADDPYYPMAHLLRDAILSGVPPHRLRAQRRRRQRVRSRVRSK
jgi:hypothetical protein